MTRSVALVALPIIFLGTWFPPGGMSAANAVVNPVLIVRPTQGHIGDPMYLSGSGLTPNTSTIFSIFCPDYVPNGPPPQGKAFKPGPKADANGRFKGFKLILGAIVPGDRPQQCTIHAQVGVDFFGKDLLPARYTILPANQPLDPCETHICHASVAARPRRVHWGLQENIEISNGWPAATANIAVTCRGSTPTFAKKSLDWEGRISTRLNVPCKPGRASSVIDARVRVHLSFARVSGDASTHFTVVR